ncbi:MAG: serine/threonine-protein kinase [Planctomycetes bacterium]|nr:serine/threonine-protein kinase [Planctomycetota bacterium]
MPDDESILDAALARFLDDVAEGREPDVAGAAAGRADLVAQIRELAAMAKQAAPRAKESRPVIGGYEILGEIGRGGMGQVYLAEDVKLRRRVALKVLPQRLASEPSRLRFEREARAVARLEHPGIVRVYESGDDGGHAWIAMEFVRGRSLAAVVAHLRSLGKTAGDITTKDFATAAGLSSVPPGTYAMAAAGVVRQVAQALACAHAQGVVHRDVKPQNVILRSDGRALLLDFGLADVEEERTLTIAGDFLGTPHYASPEQASGAVADLDGRTDVWSLGATLYEMLTLRVPFAGHTTQAVLSAIGTREPESIRSSAPYVSRDLETVCLAALEKDRAKRYATAADFAADLGAFLDGRPVGARRVGVPGRLRRWIRRHPASATAAVLAFVLCVGTPTALYVQQRAANDDVRAEKRRADDARIEAEASQRTAESERDNANAVRDFMTEIFTAADDGESGRDTKVVDALAKAEANAAKKLATKPKLRAAVMSAVASTYAGLSLHEESGAMASRAIAELEPIVGRTDPSIIDLHLCVAHAARCNADDATALAEITLACAAAVDAYGTDDPRTAAVQTGRGLVLRDAGRTAEAIEVLRAAVAVLERRAGPPDSALLSAQMNLGIALTEDAPLPEGVEFLRRAHVGWRELLGADNGNTLYAACNYGQALKEAGRLDEAGEVMVAAAGTARRGPGLRADITVFLIHNLAGLRLDQGRLDEAGSLQQELADGLAAGAIEGVPVRSMVYSQLARVRWAQGAAADAERAAIEAIPAAWAADEAPRGHASAAILIAARLKLGRVTDAAEAARDALTRTRAAAVPPSEELVGIIREVVAALRRVGDPVGAAALEAAAAR